MVYVSNRSLEIHFTGTLGGICIEQIIGDTFVLALFCDRGIEQSLWQSTVIMELFERVFKQK